MREVEAARSGIDACRQIKTDPVTRMIPVIQISATFITEKDQQEGLLGGADIYLTEPLEAKVLETVQATNQIAQKLGVTKSPFARRPEAPAAATTPAPTPTPTSS